MSKAYLVASRADGGVKSIPLNALPEEAWRRVLGVPDAAGDQYQAYEQIPWLYRGVNARCEALASLPFVFENLRGGAELEEGETPPFAFEIEIENLLNILEGFLLFEGAAYLDLGLNRFGLPTRAQLLHPSTIQPQYDADAGLVGFRRSVGGRDLTFAPDELLCIWLPSRRAEVGPGTSPVRAALHAAGLLQSVDDYGKMYFANGVIAPTIVEIPDGTLDSERDRLENWAQRRLKGLKQAFTVAAVRATIKIHQLGDLLSLGKLAIPELTDKKREDIATALGVPQTLLFSNAANYATAAQDDLHFYTKTVIPDAQRIERRLNTRLFEPLGWRLRFKPDRLEIFQQLEASKAQSLSILVGARILSVGEARQELGKPSELPDEFSVQPSAGREVAEAGMRERQMSSGRMEMPETMQQKELARWQKFALNRVREGKPEKAQTFTSDLLPASLVVYLRGALEDVTDGEAVRRAFQLASGWESYP